MAIKMHKHYVSYLFIIIKLRRNKKIVSNNNLIVQNMFRYSREYKNN